MDPITQKVLERLNYEKVLLTDGIRPRRNKITLNEILQVAQNEPRIYQVLPAILMHKMKIINRFDRDINKLPQLKSQIAPFLNVGPLPKSFYGIDMKDCMKTAQIYKRFLEQKKSHQKSRTMTLRLGEEDLERLQKLTSHLRTGSVSETIRLLAREKEGSI